MLSCGPIIPRKNSLLGWHQVGAATGTSLMVFRLQPLGTSTTWAMCGSLRSTPAREVLEAGGEEATVGPG